MTVNTASVQTASAACKAVPPLLCVASMSDGFTQIFSLLKKYCSECSVTENLVNSVVATMMVIAIYVGHSLLVGMAVLWCWAMLSLAGYRLMTASAAVSHTP